MDSETLFDSWDGDIEEEEFDEAVKALTDIGLHEDEAIQQVEDFYNLY